MSAATVFALGAGVGAIALMAIGLMLAMADPQLQPRLTAPIVRATLAVAFGARRRPDPAAQILASFRDGVRLSEAMTLFTVHDPNGKLLGLSRRHREGAVFDAFATANDPALGRLLQQVFEEQLTMTELLERLPDGYAVRAQRWSVLP